MFYSNESYRSIPELMQYFYFKFNIYVVLLIIVILNCIKAYANYRHSKTNKESLTYGISDIIVSIVCMVAFFNALMFQGVIADISATASALWFNKVMILCVISALAFIAQLYFTGQYIKVMKSKEQQV